jgi:hypothetical protein
MRGKHWKTMAPEEIENTVGVVSDPHGNADCP